MISREHGIVQRVVSLFFPVKLRKLYPLSVNKIVEITLIHSECSKWPQTTTTYACVSGPIRDIPRDDCARNVSEGKSTTRQGLVQSLNSLFFPPHIEAKPGREKRESRITSTRMQDILDSLFARPGSARIDGAGKKREFRDWISQGLICAEILPLHVLLPSP